MTLADFTFMPELAEHSAAIETINADAFGPGRFARAAYRIREGGPHEQALSFVALRGGNVIASVRMTRVAAGAGRALMLGPLAVDPAFKNLGVGKHLVKLAVEAASRAGAAAVILVGDAPYYGPLGFSRIPRGQIAMPRPVDLDRLLAVELKPDAVALLTGMVDHEDQVVVGKAERPDQDLSLAG
jgi:predicted N-acetyltransferase YhbS